MKIQAVARNNPKRAFEVKAARKTLQFPYVKIDPQPSATDPITHVFVDQELE